MSTQSLAGASLAISAGLPATEDSTGYDALTYSIVGEITDMGTIGAETNLVSYTPVATAIVNKRKGSKNYGSQSVTVVLDDEDTGQMLFETAAESQDVYSFRVTLNDGAKIYYQGLIMGFPINLGTVDDMVQVTVPIEVDSKIVRVAAP
jgi:hypothetical protein